MLELLVSMAVIGILLSILLPSLMSLKRGGKEAMAKSDMTAFVNACRLFESDYGTLPKPNPSSATAEFAAVDSSSLAKASSNTDPSYKALLGALTCRLYLSSTASSPTLNPKNVQYMQPTAKYAAIGGPCGFVDPWGNSYGLALDIDGDGKVSVPYPSGMKDSNGAALASEAVLTRVAIYSLGPEAVWSGSALASVPQRPLKSWNP